MCVFIDNRYIHFHTIFYSIQLFFTFSFFFFAQISLICLIQQATAILTDSIYCFWPNKLCTFRCCVSLFLCFVGVFYMFSFFYSFNFYLAKCQNDGWMATQGGKRAHEWHETKRKMLWYYKFKTNCTISNQKKKKKNSDIDWDFVNIY